MSRKAACRKDTTLRLRDIAKKAGVSTATISLVMNDKGAISARTRERIKKLVADSGYIYNKRAASMRTRRTYDIGVLVQDVVNPYFGEYLSGLSAYLDNTRYLYFLANSDENPDRQARLIRSFMETGMDGAILYLSRHTSPQVMDDIKKWGHPAMLAFRHFDRQDFDFLGADNYEGGRMATEALIRAGHRRIVFAGGSERSSNRADRYRGHLDALSEAGLKPNRTDNLCVDSYTRKDGIFLADRIMSSCRKATAVMFFNDALALGAMSAFQRRGLEPGRDLAVVGWDNIRESTMSLPALCTVDTDPAGMGGRMAKMLLARIADPSLPVSRILEKPKLVVRETSGCPVQAAGNSLERNSKTEETA